MFPKIGTRIGWTGWRVILIDQDGTRRTVVVAASTKRSAEKKARKLWTETGRTVFVYDCSPVSAFDPTWFDVPWSDE